MSRPFLLTVFVALALQASRAQIFSHGIPAGATSPEPDGRQHGIPASVLSPTPLPFGVNPPLQSRRIFRVQGPLRRFGTPGHRARPVFIPVPLFYSYYTDGYPSIADPSVPEAPANSAAAQQAADTSQAATDDQALRDAYLQGARDALRQEESRYGEHYMDSRERERSSRPAPAPHPKAAPEPAAETSTQEDKSPATVFIFKDGHQLETRNYAIMGQTLFDFSGKTLKKVSLDEIDAAATTKANDDRGVQVKVQ